MDPYLPRTHPHELHAGIQVKRKVELPAVHEEQMRTQHEVELSIKKRQGWQRAPDVTTVQKTALVIA
ncbi:MAG: hypothetical protein BWX86_02699 [Verrucomicrobia bacterium ADurb.Bin122]|nr:MAG: hypothetical protein BWX86_02699 [Verrucomicrobia bacterium ADurb.Bin122]